MLDFSQNPQHDYFLDVSSVFVLSWQPDTPAGYLMILGVQVLLAWIM